MEWPTFSKQLQRFLGFANFYCHFIKGYSRIAAPLTKLASPSRELLWSMEAVQPFKELKTRFSSAPVVVHPDVKKQFVVEVDASALEEHQRWLEEAEQPFIV